MTILSMEGEGEQIAVSVPLFLRKLWKMVNDQEAENIIGWNSTGDGFVIHDQLQFITKLLPKYFKHNNMASFIRQLNFYDFHKVAGLEKDVMQFTHNCFLKDVPETLVFIKRKCTSLRSKLANHTKDEELSGILNGVKELKSKHSLVDNELKMLKQENAALWSEVNNLRIKHAKQTKIINKIIHFLISYIHSQNTLSKGKVAVGRRNSQNIKTGPTLLEIDYHDDPSDIQRDDKQNYLVEPGHSGAITYPSIKTESFSNMQPAERTLDEILYKVGANIAKNKQIIVGTGNAQNLMAEAPQNLQPRVKVEGQSDTSQPQLQVNPLPNAKSKTLASNKKHVDLYNPVYKKQLPVQNSLKFNILQNPKEHLGLYLDDAQVEINSLQDMLNNLSSSELTNFCNLIEEAEAENQRCAESEYIDQEVDNELAARCDDNWIESNNDNWAENSDEALKEELVDQLATIPVESIIVNEMPEDLETGQYSAENLPGVETEDLADQYFAI